MNLTFKFGSGVLPLTIKLIQQISDYFQKQHFLKIVLINESKSSKVKIQDLKRKFKTKHELSALILALRKGVEVNHSGNLETYKKVKLQDSNYINEFKNIKEDSDYKIRFLDMIEKIIKDEISLSESSKYLH